MFKKLMVLVATLALPGTSLQAVELIMVEEVGCVWCAEWNETIAPIYPKTAEGKFAPLRRIDIHDPSPADLTFKSRPMFTPTFILVDQGRELGRIEGYPGEDFFWGLLERILLEETNYTRPNT